MGNWTRMKNDDMLKVSPSEDAKSFGRIYKTYGVKILDAEDGYYKVFSPDFNRNGYVLKENVIKINNFIE